MLDIIEKYGDKEYKVMNGTWYDIRTSDKLVSLLEEHRQYGTRLRFHWGNTETGEDWGDIYDVAGKIGRSMGPVKAPLLIKTRRSIGGGCILDHCIVKITLTTKPHKVLYQHPTYHTKVIS